MIVFSISAKFLAKDPPPSSESSEDDPDYIPYSKSYFSESGSDLSPPSDGDTRGPREDEEHEPAEEATAQQEPAENQNEEDALQQEPDNNQNEEDAPQQQPADLNNQEVAAHEQPSVMKPMFREMNNFRMQQASNGTKILWRRIQVQMKKQAYRGRYCVNMLSKKASSYKGLKMTRIDIQPSMPLKALLPESEQESGCYYHLGRIEIQGSD
ncbi:hypothetical protein ACOSP7_010651 [Xanthoceras sorbifolium]